MACEGTTDFWVSPDGSYMEVGQKNVKGRIWDKVILYIDGGVALFGFSCYFELYNN